MTSFSVDLMALTIPHLTSGMWRIVKSSCLLAQEGLILMMIVSNEHVYIYIKKNKSLLLCGFSYFAKLHLLLTYYNKVHKKFYVPVVSQTKA